MGLIYVGCLFIRFLSRCRRPYLPVPFVAVPDAGCAMRQFGNGSFMMLHNGMQITDRIVFSAI